MTTSRTQSAPGSCRHLGRAPHAAFAVFGILLAGCQSPGPGPAPGPSPEPGVLDVLSWSIVADSPALAQALGEAPPASHVPDSVRERYRANGIRCVELTLDELDALRRALPPVGSSERLAIAEGPGWTTLVQSPPIASGARLSIDSGPLRLPEGRLRLLARAWREPLLGLSGPPISGVAMELAVEFETTPERQDTFDPTLPDESRRQRFSRMNLVAAESRTIAYLLVPEDPRADWTALLANPDGATPEPATFKPGANPDAAGAGAPPKPAEPPTPEPAPEAASNEPLGPFAAPDATFGQVLLGPAPGSARRLRRVLVLIPRVEAEFRLAR